MFSTITISSSGSYSAPSASNATYLCDLLNPLREARLDCRDTEKRNDGSHNTEMSGALSADGAAFGIVLHLQIPSASRG